MAAIFDLRHSQTSNSIIIFTACFMALKTFYCRWNYAAIMHNSWDTCNYIISAAIWHFWLPVSSGSVTDTTIEKFDRKNIGVTVGILFLASLEADIPLGVVLPPPPLQYKRH